MWEVTWNTSSAATSIELAERLRRLTKQGTDFERNLYVSPHHPQEVTEQGFYFAVTQALGRSKVLLWCVGTFNPTPAGTAIQVRLRPTSQVFWLLLLLAVPFGAVFLGGFWPISPAAAIGSAVAVFLLLAVMLGLGMWSSIRWIRRQLYAVLSATAKQPDADRA